MNDNISKYSEESFIQILEAVKPYRIIVWGRKVRECIVKMAKVKRTSNRDQIIEINNSKYHFYFMSHPSQLGKSMKGVDEQINGLRDFLFNDI